MPMLLTFDQRTYSPGSIVSGHVIIILKSPQKVKGLSLQVSGRINRFIRNVGSDNSIGEPLLIKKKNSAKRKELYFDEKIDVFGHDGADTVLKIGESIFPFSFTLPLGLPSSFTWPKGNIIYIVEARLTRSSWNKNDKKACRSLSIEGIYDLNLDPMALVPISVQKYKYVQFLLSKTGPFGFSLASTKSGWVKGHSVLFHLEMKNLSKVDAKKIKVSLIQEIFQDGKRLWTSTVQEAKGPAVCSGQVQNWDARLKIPAEIPPTNLGNVLNFPHFLGLIYFIQIEMTPRATGVEGISVKVPISIGTIPLTGNRTTGNAQQVLCQNNNRSYHHPHHENTCPLSSSANPITPSQFSPMLIQQQQQQHSFQIMANYPYYNMQHQHYRNCENSADPSTTDAYRRLRNLQQQRRRRRRESPPPTYDEVVGLERGEINHDNEIRDNQDQNQTQSPQNDDKVLLTITTTTKPTSRDDNEDSQNCSWSSSSSSMSSPSPNPNYKDDSPSSSSSYNHKNQFEHENAVVDSAYPSSSSSLLVPVFKSSHNSHETQGETSTSSSSSPLSNQIITIVEINDPDLV